MDQFLLTLFFFARPIMFIDTGIVAGGLNFFEMVTIIFSLVLALLALWHTITGRPKAISLTEWLIVAFTFWCTATLLIYPEHSNFKTYVKFVLPLVTFMILKRILTNRTQYLNLLKWMIIGFSIPIVLSSIWTLLGRGIGQEIYWTGLVRYQGVYADIHNMGHCMGFLIMLCAMYTTLHRTILNQGTSLRTYFFLFILGALALFCLYMSQTRTVYFGLLLFFFIALFLYNRAQLIIFSGTILLGVILFAPLLSKIFYDIVDASKGKKMEMAGSGRPHIWKHNLEIYASLPLDRQIAGVGIGNTLLGNGEQFTQRTKISIDNVWNSHNDILEVLMETGAIGLLLWLALMVTILVKILTWEGQERWIFFSFFVSVLLMNFLSNSYVSRFGLAQMYFMVLSYFEISKTSSGLTYTRDQRLFV